ncbi:MAG: hypothetical protein KC478_13540, partial [Bacteriovoracaceae bacterium]|nr:hypothetical protein [Bacteriovoracaceae bacterium]
MKLSLLRLLSLTLLLTVAAATPSFAQYGTQEKVAYIEQYLRKGDKLDLMRELNLKQALRDGSRLIALRVEASSYENAKLVLKHNGQRLQALAPSSYSMEISMQTPASLQPQDKLVLAAKGEVRVAKLVAVIQSTYTPPRNPGQGQGVLKARVNKQVYGHEVFAVKRLVKNQTGARLQGLQVKKVIVKGNSTSYYGQATVQLKVNGQLVGFPQTLNSQSSRLALQIPAHMPSVIGQGLRQIKVVVRGDAYIQMVGLKTQQARDPRRGGNQGSAQVHLNQQFRGNQVMNLDQLLSRAGSRVDVYSPVEALTFVARGYGSIVVQSRGSVHGVATVVNRGTQTIRISGSNSLRDLKLRVTGNMTIETVRVKTRY